MPGFTDKLWHGGITKMQTPWWCRKKKTEKGMGRESRYYQLQKMATECLPIYSRSFISRLEWLWASYRKFLIRAVLMLMQPMSKCSSSLMNKVSSKLESSSFIKILDWNNTKLALLQDRNVALVTALLTCYLNGIVLQRMLYLHCFSKGKLNVVVISCGSVKPPPPAS